MHEQTWHATFQVGRLSTGHNPQFIFVPWRVYNYHITEISDIRQHCPMSDHSMVETTKNRVLNPNHIWTIIIKRINAIWFWKLFASCNGTIGGGRQTPVVTFAAKLFFSRVSCPINKSLFLVQVDLHIQEFTLDKSPGKFKKDSECQNQNMWTPDCK